MTENNEEKGIEDTLRNNQAFLEAQKELEAEKVAKIKGIMKNLLQEIQLQKDVKAKAEDALRILKMEMEDLQAGNLDKIRDRHQSNRVQKVSPIPEEFLGALLSSPIGWNTYHSNYGICGDGVIADAGSYTVSASNSSSTSYNSAGSTTLKADWWGDATGGVYRITLPNGEVKEFYI
jgi:hypothetical protein